jgi:hypothetical protein
MTEPSFNSCPTCSVPGWDKNTFCHTCFGKGSLPPEKEAVHLEARFDEIVTTLKNMDKKIDKLLKIKGVVLEEAEIGIE